jgi:hypothetical protein
MSIDESVAEITAKVTQGAMIAMNVRNNPLSRTIQISQFG